MSLKSCIDELDERDEWECRRVCCKKIKMDNYNMQKQYWINLNSFYPHYIFVKTSHKCIIVNSIMQAEQK